MAILNAGRRSKRQPSSVLYIGIECDTAFNCTVRAFLHPVHGTSPLSRQQPAFGDRKNKRTPIVISLRQTRLKWASRLGAVTLARGSTRGLADGADARPRECLAPGLGCLGPAVASCSEPRKIAPPQNPIRSR